MAGWKDIAVHHVDIVFDGPPGHEAGRFIEVEDAAGNSIKLGEWIETDKGGPVAGSAVAYTKPTWVLRFEDPRELRRHVDAVWELLDHRVDGQPFWSDRAANGGGETMDLGIAVALVLRHYRDEIAKWKAAWGSKWSAEENTPDKLERWRKEVDAQRETASNSIHDLEERTVSQAHEIRALRMRIERRDGEYDQRLAELENAKLRIKQLENEKAELDRSAKSAAAIATEQITKLCERGDVYYKHAADLDTENAKLRTARDQLFADLQALREATMLEPAGGDWAKITPDHLRQHVQDMGDQITRLTRERDQIREELAPWTKAALHLDHTIITPKMLELAATRVSDELAAARVARDGWRDAARRIANRIDTPAQLVEVLDSLQEGVRTGSRACVELEALRKEYDRARTLLDTLGRILIPVQLGAGRERAGHEIERAALDHAGIRDALAEVGKVLGIQLTPHELVERFTRMRETLDTRSKQLEAENAITARFRKALVIRNSPGLDPAAELEEIRAIVLASLKRAEPVPTTPLITLVGELAGAHDTAVAERDEMAQEMAREVNPEDVVHALQIRGAQLRYDRETMREAIVSDIRGMFHDHSGISRHLSRDRIGRIADAALDRFEGLIKAPIPEAVDEDEDEDEDEEITITLDDAICVLQDELADTMIPASVAEDLVAAFAARWEDDDDDDAEPIDTPELSEAQLDKLADKIAARMKGGR